MTPFTDDESSYIADTLKSVKRSFRIMGGGILVASALAGGPLLKELMPLEGFPETGTIINLILTSLFFLTGLALFISSFFEETLQEKETYTGRFRLKFYRGKHICKIGKRRVIIPSTWQDWFRRGEEYTVEVFTCRIGLIRPAPLVLTVEGLPESLASAPLMEIKTSEKWLVSRVYRTSLVYGFFMILPFLGIYGLVSYLSKNPEGVNRFFTRHSESITGFFTYLQDHDFLMQVFGFFFRYGFIIFVVAIILIITLVRRKVPAQSRDDEGRYLGEELAVSWSRWISDYEDFLENKLKPVMHRGRGKDPAVLIEYKEVMNQYGILQREFKKYKKTLSGTERSAFVREFKKISKRAGESGSSFS